MAQLHRCIDDEFSRLTSGKGASSSGRGYLTVDDMQAMRLPASLYVLEASHLPTLLLADADRDGRFTLPELRALIDSLSVEAGSHTSPYQFKSRVRAAATEQARHALRKTC